MVRNRRDWLARYTAFGINSLEPVDPEDLLDAGTHGVSTISSTLQGASHFVLGKIVHELVHCETESSQDEAISINCDSVICSDSVLEWAMVPIEIVAFSDEAVSWSERWT